MAERRDGADAGAPGRAVPPRAARRWRLRLAEEQAAARVYRDLAGRRQGEEREVLLGLAEAEERHAAHWRALLDGDGTRDLPAPPLRARALGWMARRFGSVFVLALLQRAEADQSYDADRDATPAMAADERVHAEVLRGLAGRRRAEISGTFRAGVFGANDGLVSNLALVLGMAGAGVGADLVLTAGLAGLLAGALSMGAGEYVSVRSQRELIHAGAPPADTREVARLLDVDSNELALVYRAGGVSAEEAERRAAALLEWAARGALGDAPGPPAPATTDADVVGSAAGAAGWSFASFAAGAAVPVVPFLVLRTATGAAVTACLLVALALLATGATAALLSGGPVLRRALRQLAIGAGAAGVTFALGRLLDVTVT